MLHLKFLKNRIPHHPINSSKEKNKIWSYHVLIKCSSACNVSCALPNFISLLIALWFALPETSSLHYDPMWQKYIRHIGDINNHAAACGLKICWHVGIRIKCTTNKFALSTLLDSSSILQKHCALSLVPNSRSMLGMLNHC